MNESSSCFAYRSTVSCALNECIPCFYKLFPNGLFPLKSVGSTRKRKFSEDGSEEPSLKLPPNQRPENCRRAKQPEYSGLYSSNQKVLTVGDGDLSFSLSLSNALSSNGPSSASNLVATTYESHEKLIEIYPDIRQTIDGLRSNKVSIFHSIDATNLSPLDNCRLQPFDIIIWNFPCIRIEKGFDGQVAELDQNKDLLRRFFRNVTAYLASDGEIHVTHKTIEPFSWWGIEDIALEEGFRCSLKIVFDKYDVHSVLIFIKFFSFL
jgi:25S rRNA (uracil2634-N3)-methyltransferase